VTNWDDIIALHGPAVWRTAYRLLGNADDAEECLQDVFLSAWEFSRRDRIRHWPAFLKQLATRRALDRLRQRARHTELVGHPDRWTVPPSDCNEPLAAAQAGELGERLRIALTELPPQQAQAFCLCCIEGVKYRQAASVMDVKTNAIKVLVHRARTRLRELLVTVVVDQDTNGASS